MGILPKQPFLQKKKLEKLWNPIQETVNKNTADSFVLWVLITQNNEI